MIIDNHAVHLSKQINHLLLMRFKFYLEHFNVAEDVTGNLRVVETTHLERLFQGFALDARGEDH